MIFKVLTAISLSLFGFQFQEEASESRLPVQEQEERYFILDYETLEFLEVSKTPATVDSLIALGNQTRNRDSRISFHVAREALNLAREIGYTEGEARAHNLVGIKYLDFGKYELALEHYMLSMEIETILDNHAGIANMLSNIGLVHLEQANYDKSTEFFLASVELRENLGQRRQAYIALNNLGVVHRRQGNYDDALEYFFRAYHLSLAQEEGADSLMHMISTLNIGNTYRNKGDLERAPEYLNRAGAYFDRNNLTISQTYTNLFLGQFHRDIQDYGLALEYASKTLELAIQEQQRERIKDAYLLIAEIYANMGDYKQALEHHKLYQQASDSLLNIQRSERISRMQIRFDVEQKDREIELLGKEAALQEARIAQQEQMRAFLLAGLALLVVIAGLLLRNNQQKRKNNNLLKNRRQEIEGQNLKLANLNREKDEFMSVAAHDLRNPLSVIKTAVELLLLEKNPDKEIVEEYTDLIEVSSDRMLNLIDNLLDIQSINDGNNNAPVEKLHVNNSLQLAVQHFQHSALSKGMQLNTELNPETGLVLADKENLVRIFDNLISNAIKYSPPGSLVLVKTEAVDTNVRIAVCDNGPGITEKDQARLFERFARLSNKPTGNESSTGLGLYIVKKLVTSMNGRVWCESEIGKGSVFYVEFPSAENGVSSNPR